jgi:hypothetical protein
LPGPHAGAGERAERLKGQRVIRESFRSLIGERKWPERNLDTKAKASRPMPFSDHSFSTVM